MIIGNGSGNAETVSSGTTPLGVRNKPETVGKILVGSKAIVIDPNTKEEKTYGEEGLLCISGKHVFQCYYGEPDLTRQAKLTLKGKSYFVTGAMGFIDTDGYFTLTGRASRFYIMSSLNKVYLDHVQTIINHFDCVKECAVIKVPDPDLLFVNHAFVVPAEDYKDLENLKDRIFTLCKSYVVLPDGSNDQLKDFEIPHEIHFLDELPRRAGTEKINYQILEQSAQ